MRAAPWTSAQARLVGGCNVVAAALILLSAAMARDASLRNQVAWLNVAVLAVVLAVVGNGSLFLVGRRAVGRRRLVLVPDVHASIHERSARATADDGWQWVAGTVRAHRLGCPMTEGKSPRPVSDRDIRAKRLSRCEICG